jgi:hypothetical protein
MSFFDRYEWSPLAKYFCGLFVFVGLMKLGDGGSFYIVVGLFCFYAWKQPKAVAPAAEHSESADSASSAS